VGDRKPAAMTPSAITTKAMKRTGGEFHNSSTMPEGKERDPVEHCEAEYSCRRKHASAVLGYKTTKPDLAQDIFCEFLLTFCLSNRNIL
jgi:hypothetical protein